MSSKNQPFANTILGAPLAGPLKECTPNLMPFHIDYTGPAPMSTFFSVVEAAKNVGAPEKETPEGEGGEGSAEEKDAASANANSDVSLSEQTTKTVDEKTVSVELTDVKIPADAPGVDAEMQDVSEQTQSTEEDIQADVQIGPSSETTLALQPTASTSTITSTTSTSTMAVIETEVEASSSSSTIIVPSSSSSSSTNSTTLPSSFLSLKSRFKSTFRGRIMQGLSVDVPKGYMGVVLRSSDDTSLKAAQATVKMSAKVQASKKGKGRAAAPGGKGKRTGKGKAEVKQEVEVDMEVEDTGKGKRTTRRSTRSTARASVVDVETVEEDDEEETQAPDNEDGDDGEPSSSWSDGKNKTKTLIPSSTFSSFILWHPDIPVDEGKDEYFGALNEWVGIAEAIHRIPVD